VWRDRVRLGFRPNLDELLVAADVFVLPSRREGMANVMLEAMAAGCLVVAADVSGVREAVGAREGRPQAGWIVPPDDVAALAASLGQALDELASGAAQTRKAELHWRSLAWFSPERTVVETERVLMGASRTPGD
jgi:glycosyltransferase involved in cell wall biosynthesis